MKNSKVSTNTYNALNNLGDVEFERLTDISFLDDQPWEKYKFTLWHMLLGHMGGRVGVC